ncbi:MAG: hypothetical protein JSV16_09340 [Candidatus Hydrogenedentota bacterium]|nr:MAG: hypothetical protein JSV16_09340 [Candidatus Hydrogenedentota bacterium]
MKLESLREKQGVASISLLCASGVLGILIVVRLGSFFAASARMERLVEEAVAQAKPDPNGAKDYIARFKEAADELKKNNMFAPPPPKPGWPVSRVEGILGDTAFINGDWRKVGDNIGGAKVLEIGPSYVKLEWEGQQKTFFPFDVGTVPEPKKEKKAVQKPKPKKKKIEEKPVEKEEVAQPEGDDPLAWMGVELSPRLRAKILEKWDEMSDEQKEEAKREWNNLSDEQKEERVKMMEEHVDDM